MVFLVFYWIKKFKKYFNFQEENKGIPSLEILRHFERVFLLFSFLVDAYLLGRMFRNYNEKPGKYSLPAKNIVVYAGFSHIRIYMEFFREIGFKIIYDNTKNFVGKPTQSPSALRCIFYL